MCPVNPPSVLDGVARCSGLQRESLLRVDLEISSENHILWYGDYVIIVDLSFIVNSNPAWPGSHCVDRQALSCH